RRCVRRRHPRDPVHRRRRVPPRPRRPRRLRDGGVVTLTRVEALKFLPPARLFIGGRWVAESSGGGGVHRDPTTGDGISSYLLAGEADVDAAVGAGRDA